MYFRPNPTERALPPPSGRHAILLVESVKLNMRSVPEQFVIIQNSYGESYGFKGFVLFYLFTSFLFPILNEKMERVQFGKGTTPSYPM